MEKLVLLSSVSPRIFLDIVYTTIHNFTGEILYLMPIYYLQKKIKSWASFVNIWPRLFFFLFLFASCSPSSLHDIRCEADSEITKLVLDLQLVKSKEDLQKQSVRIKKRFNRMADLLIAARNFELTASEASIAAETLFVELARLYEIPGVRDLMENLQEEAVRRLDKKSRKASSCID